MNPLSRATWKTPSGACSRRALLGLLLLLTSATMVRARSPRTGDYALTFAAGADDAVHDDAFGDDLTLQFSMDFHWTAASSVRGTLGWLSLPSRDGSDRGDLSALYVTGNVSRNFWRRAVIPYVTGGVGLYTLRESAAPESEGRWLAVGINFGGGLEFRLTESLTLRLEGLVHAMTGDGPSTVATGTLGIKYYF